MLNPIYQTEKNITIRFKDIIFGYAHNSIDYRTLDLIMLITKYYIYKQKLKKAVPTLPGLLRDLCIYYHIEEFIYKKNCNHAYFLKKWSTYGKICEDNV